MKIKVIRAVDLIEPFEIEQYHDIYCPEGMAYFVPDTHVFNSPYPKIDRLKLRYDNVLKGLYYWRQRALLNEFESLLEDE